VVADALGLALGFALGVLGVDREREGEREGERVLATKDRLSPKTAWYALFPSLEALARRVLTMDCFEFEKLEVYQLALDYVVVADGIAEALPGGRGYLKTQIRKAANSITDNIAEGAGEFANKEKVRFYRMARRSAVESASQLLVCQSLQLVASTLLTSGLDLLRRIVAMLTSMIKNVLARDAHAPHGRRTASR
jgi:four helix bundle protein